MICTLCIKSQYFLALILLELKKKVGQNIRVWLLSHQHNEIMFLSFSVFLIFLSRFVRTIFPLLFITQGILLTVLYLFAAPFHLSICLTLQFSTIIKYFPRQPMIDGSPIVFNHSP